MKRWNRKGSVHAKRRMEELRGVALDARKSEAIAQWAQATGNDPKTWWQAAQAAGITSRHSQLERVQWLEGAVST